MTKLSTTAHTILTAAAERADQIVLAPERLPAAARRAVVQSLLKARLLEEVAADYDQPAWRTTDAGERFALRATEAGLHAAGVGTADISPEPAQCGLLEAETASAARHAPEQTGPAQDAPVASQAGTRPTVRAAAQAVMAAWDEAGRSALPDAIAALRTALAAVQQHRPARATSGAPRTPRTDTKQAAVLALLLRPEGASGPQMIEATGWAPHTVRGFLAGLAKTPSPCWTACARSVPASRAAWVPGSTCPLSSAWGGADGSAPGPRHPPGAHAVATARGRLLGSGGRYARRGRSHDAGLCRDGAEGAGADQRAHAGRVGGGQGAGGGAGRGPRLPAVSGAVCCRCGLCARGCRYADRAPALAGDRGSAPGGGDDLDRPGPDAD